MWPIGLAPAMTEAGVLSFILTRVWECPSTARVVASKVQLLNRQTSKRESDDDGLQMKKNRWWPDTGQQLGGASCR